MCGLGMWAPWEEVRSGELCAPVSFIYSVGSKSCWVSKKNKQNDPVALGDICPLGQLLAFGFGRVSVDSTDEEWNMFPLNSEGGLAGPIGSEPSWWSINQPVPECKKKTSAADSLRGGQTTEANVIPNEGQLWGCMIKTRSAVNSGLWHMWLTDLFSHAASATEHFPLSPHMSQQNSEVS